MPFKLLPFLCLLACSSAPVVTSANAPANPAERLVWADEFNGPGNLPNPANWSYETGGGGWGNHELETYCAPSSTAAPCDPAHPNVSIGGSNSSQPDGLLHLTARRDSRGAWTSARLLTKGLQSFTYGRMEARLKIPAGAGVWPAFWMLGANIDTVPWPACGELDIMENIGKEPATVHGSIHGTGFTGTPLGQTVQLPSGQPFSADFHTFGLVWSPGRIEYYVDDPTRPYAAFTPANLPPGATWPFDGHPFFLLLNLAIGGDWPGPPTPSTPANSELLVDYVRVYQTAPASPAP